MSTSRDQWLLKVIAGPNKGAEAGLRAGKTLIGSDEECDVVLHDVLVAPQHLEIEAGPNGITGAPLGGRIYINGKRVRDARQAVPDFAFITVGGTHLIIGPGNSKWPLLSPADVPELEREVETPVAEKEDAEPDEVSTPSDAQAKTEVLPTPRVDRQTRSRAFVGIGAGVLLLFVWFLAFVKYSGDSTQSEDASASPKPAELVRNVVLSMGLGDSIKIEDSRGHVSVSGYVDTEARQRELQAALRQAVPGLNTRIYSLEKIASTARAFLDDEPYPLTVTSLSDGRIKVTGKLPAAEPWVKMRETLRRSVPGLSGIEDGVEIETPQVATAPRTVVPQIPARPSPAITPAAPIPAAVPGGADYSAAPDTIDTIQATIATIKVSDDLASYVRFSSGGVYFEGARLPYGGRIVSINFNGVTIDDDDGTTRTIQQGDLVAKPKQPLQSLSTTSTSAR